MTTYHLVDGDGEVTRILSVSDPSLLFLNLLPGETAPFDPPPAEAAYFDFEASTWTLKPPQPGPQFSWDPKGKAWVDQRPFQLLKDTKWEAIKASRLTAEQAPFEWNGLLFDADAERVNGAATGALIAQATGSPFSIDWTLTDNSVVALSGADMISVGVALLQHVSAAHERGRLLRAAIDSATTQEQLDAISW